MHSKVPPAVEPATTPPTPGVFLTSLLLTGVTNGNNENVQGNMGPYFQLDNLGSWLFNISLMSKYFEVCTNEFGGSLEETKQSKVKLCVVQSDRQTKEGN